MHPETDQGLLLALAFEVAHLEALVIALKQQNQRLRTEIDQLVEAVLTQRSLGVACAAIPVLSLLAS